MLLKRKMKRIVLALLLSLLVWNSCSKAPAKLEWPSSGISQVIPQPDFAYGEVNVYSSSLSADFEKTSLDDFHTYVKRLEAAGFTIEPETSNTDFSAFNKDGYKIHTYYSDSSKKGGTISLMLNAPETYTDLDWPAQGPAALLPNPQLKKGKIFSNTSERFSAALTPMDKKAFQAYVKACREAGFDVDFSQSETSYRASNPEGYQLHLSYEGFNQIDISVSAPEKPEETPPSEEETTENSLPEEALPKEETSQPEEMPEAAEAAEAAEAVAIVAQKPLEETSSASEEKSASSSSSIGVREMLEEYEAFMDEYIAFMQKYKEADNPIGLLSDYYDFLNRYSEFLEKIDDMDQDDMSLEDAQYYLEVTGRVAKKLTQAAL